ncbi:hypothetical protein H2201_009279, partial [Coniosporium apollinis]
TSRTVPPTTYVEHCVLILGLAKEPVVLNLPKWQQYRKDHGIKTVDNWPPYSPDLHPIEDTWQPFKDIVEDMDIKSAARSIKDHVI